LGAILDDIVEASQRAFAVMQRVRALFLRRGRDPVNRDPVDRDPVERDPVDLNAVARDAVALALDPRAIPLRGDAVQLRQVLLNLILNACDALDAKPPGARHIAIATAGGPGPLACLTVTDNGAGIAGARPERVFDAFYTTKPHGIGVGLAVARAIVAAGGAVFRVTLPLAGERHDE
jgi:signal transduction histidine kinase